MKLYDENGKYVGDFEPAPIVPPKKKYLRAFRTKFDMPSHPKGTVFVYDPNDHEKGNLGNGALRLAWVKGNCQNNWCGGAVAFPGQEATHYFDSKFWEEIPNNGEYT